MSKVRLFGHSLLWLTTVSVVVLAVLLIGARFLSTQVPAYKNELGKYLSEEIGAEVVIAEMSASMNGFQPQISLTGITLDELKNQTNTLSIGEIRLSFNPLNFISGQINPNKIIIVNTSISIKRFSDGHLSIVGFSNDTSEESSSGDFSWLLEDGNYEVVDSRITWQDDMRDLPDIALSEAHIVFQNTGHEHLLKMKATLPKDTGGSLVLSIKATGDVLSNHDWRAEGYLKANQIDVAKYLPRLKVDKLSIKQGVGDIELWSKWDAAQLVQVKGNVLVTKARFSQQDEVLNISNLSSQFGWKKITDGWLLQANKFSFKTHQAEQESSQFSIEYRTKGIHSRINASTDSLNLAAMADVLQYANILDEKSLSLINDAKPSGELHEAEILINTADQQLTWAFCGQLEGFSNQAFGTIPAIDNFTGRGCSNQDSGWLNINTSKASVYVTDLFRDPIAVETLKGQLTWEKSDGGWEVNSDELALISPHIDLRTRVNVSLPTDGTSPNIDMQTNFGQADSRYVSLYLPVGIMGKGIADWLDNAFSEGQVTGGGLVLKGELAKFPYRQKDGVFQVLFDTENVLLHYADKWPDVSDVAAEVEFKNEGMTIEGVKGQILANKIAHVVVAVSDLERDQYLNLTGSIEDDISGLYTFFKQSPIHKTVGTLLEHSVISGQANVDLSIKIPLKDNLKAQVKAQALLANNKLHFPELDLSIDKVSGIIKYNEHGLSAKAIKGRFLGQAIKVDIAPKKNNTVIVAHGNLNIERLADKYPAGVWGKLSGSSPANLTITLPHSGLKKGANATLSLQSDLVGINVDLPQPVGKEAGAALAFELMAALGQDYLPVKAAYGKGIHGSFQFNKNKKKSLELYKGDIHFGAADAKLPLRQGIQLSGFLDSLDIAKWKASLSSKELKNTSPVLVNQIDLKVATLNWLDSTFNDVHVTGKNDQATWVGEIESPLVSGKYILPEALGDGDVIRLDLTKLTLPEVDTDKLGDKKSPLNPDEIPNVNLNSKALYIGGSNLGSLELKLRKKEHGMIIEKLSLKSKRDKLQAYGAWEQNDASSRTGLKGRLSSESLGSLLKETGIFSDLREAKADIDFDLHWPGEPQEFSKSHLNGFSQIKTGKGKLLDVEPGIGRIFGLLSLSTLQRRLQLDFSDLVERGLSFDKIKGRLTIIDGDAIIKRFYLDSPSARLDFEGRVGLGKEDLDQLITVTPNTTESLPVAGALAGGPLVGAAVYIVQKIAGKTVNKLVGYQYRVTGPWANPKIKKISKPGDKIFGMVGDVLNPFFDATIGQLSIDAGSVPAPVR